jgi:hypothetical protein
MKATGWTTMHMSAPTGITFNNRPFTEPTLFHLTLLPVSSGIYAILIPDPLCRPRPFCSIYFGESSSFSERVTEHHECYNDWVTEAGGVANLYVAFCSTPFLREEQRRWVENDLIARYRPVCNLKASQAQFFYQPLLGIVK